jgi:hypothetical protein
MWALLSVATGAFHCVTAANGLRKLYLKNGNRWDSLVTFKAFLLTTFLVTY